MHFAAVASGALDEISHKTQRAERLMAIAFTGDQPQFIPLLDKRSFYGTIKRPEALK
jgi:hypothetical protein